MNDGDGMMSKGRMKKNREPPNLAPRDAGECCHYTWETSWCRKRATRFFESTLDQMTFGLCDKHATSIPSWANGCVEITAVYLVHDE